MNLLPDGIKAQLPALYETEALGLSAFAKVKFFTPQGNWTWYASEFDDVDIFFGLVIGFEVELGYFSLSELESLNKPNEALLVERDLYFKETPLLELREHYQKNGWSL